MNIDTLRKLHDCVVPALEAHRATRSLEEYLRAIWNILETESFVAGYDSFAQILVAAFASEPAGFETAWLTIDEPPELEEVSGLESVKHQLAFLISDLHRMKDVGTLDEPCSVLYGGVDSPTGHRWYNFDPCTFVECALRGAVDSSGTDADLRYTHPDWSEFAGILDLGRVYE